MSTCKICRKNVRKTVIANIIQKGALVSGRICQKCASEGVLICADGDKPLVCSCGAGATCCNACVAKEALAAVKRAGDMKKHVKHLKGLVRAYERASTLGPRIAEPHVLGLEMAINYLESAAALVKEG